MVFSFSNLVLANKKINSKSSPITAIRFQLRKDGKQRNQTETPISGNVTLTNNNTVIQSTLGKNNSENMLTEPSQVSNEIQVWTHLMEQKSNDRIEKMRLELDN